MSDPNADSSFDQILIVCPYASHPGHHWNNAEQIAVALSRERKPVTIFIHDATVRQPAPEIAESIKAAPKWWQATARAVSNSIDGSPSHAIRMQLETLGTVIALSQTPKKIRQRAVIHFIDATFLIFLTWQFFARERCVYNLMGGSEPIQRVRLLPNPIRWLKRTLTRALLAVSLRRGLLEFCAETEAVARDWVKIVDEHVHVIPYAVCSIESPIPKTKARAELQLDQTDLILLLFGTQRQDKDLLTVIRAAKQLSTSPFLLFAGKHLSGAKPSTLVHQLKLENYRILDRFVNDSEAALCFAACDAVALPYNEGYEKGSGVLIEACQHLRPVIATDTGYLREFVQRFGTGWLFRAGDSGDLARCMHALTNLTPPERIILEKNILATAREHSWARIIRQYLLLYARLVGTDTK
jgi:glycosyltransferase involved in cell wall biosynthesis